MINVAKNQDAATTTWGELAPGGRAWVVVDKVDLIERALDLADRANERGDWGAARAHVHLAMRMMRGASG